MKVLVADDHEFVRGGLVSELTDILPDAHFYEAGNADEALNTLNQWQGGGLAIIDLYMPGSNQYELITTVCKNFPKVIVIIMTASEDKRDMDAVIDCGVAAYIPKTLGKDIVHHVIGLVLAGGTYFPEDICTESSMQSVNQKDSAKLQEKIAALTPRQKEVLALLLEGEANRNIADALNMSENTVKIHLTAIFKTLHFKSRAQVIASVRGAEFKIFK